MNINSASVPRRLSSIVLTAMVVLSGMTSTSCGDDAPAAEIPRPEIGTRVYSKDHAWYCEFAVFNDSKELLTIQRQHQGFIVKQGKAIIAMERYRDADALITLWPQEGFTRRVKIVTRRFRPAAIL